MLSAYVTLLIFLPAIMIPASASSSPAFLMMYCAYKFNKQVTIYSLDSFPYMEPVCCSTSSSNCCFLTCIQVSQKAGQVVWHSHHFKNFPQGVVIHTIKGFGIVNKAKVDVFLELSFLMIQWMLAIWSPVPLPFLNPAWTSGSSQFMYYWNLAWRIWALLTSMWDECNCVVVWAFFGIAFLWD